MKKYLAILKGSFLNSLVYRANFFFWGTGELLDTLVFLFIWMVIYGERQAVGGFTLSQTITYLIGVGMISNLVYSWIGDDLEQDVRRGTLSAVLTRPVAYPLVRAMTSLANKPVDILVRLGVYLAVAFFFREKFILNSSPFTWFLLLFSIGLAFLINYLINFCFGCVAFWTTVSGGMFHILRVVMAVLSGGYAPLTFFPFWFQRMANFLPFVYIRYFPMLIYLKKISTIEIILGLFAQVIWISLLVFLARFLWKRGLRKYEGVGI